MDALPPPAAPPAPRGRGAGENPENRFTRLSVEADYDGGELPPERVATRFFVDGTRTALARNDSPDVGFAVSLNPYRGCEHGCIYCYARPTHEYLGFSAGLDFETRILVKEDAPELLRKELSARSWEPQTIAISGVTDPYQPVERKLEITRRCLAVLAEFGNPVAASPRTPWCAATPTSWATSPGGARRRCRCRSPASTPSCSGGWSRAPRPPRSASRPSPTSPRSASRSR